MLCNPVSVVYLVVGACPTPARLAVVSILCGILHSPLAVPQGQAYTTSSTAPTWHVSLLLAAAFVGAAGVEALWGGQAPLVHVGLITPGSLTGQPW